MSFLIEGQMKIFALTAAFNVPAEIFLCMLQVCVCVFVCSVEQCKSAWVGPSCVGVPDMLVDGWEDGWELPGLTGSGTTGSH